MKIIALTGGIGAGKSVVAAEFARLGAEVIDSDKVSHELMMPGQAVYKEVAEEFGDGILANDGTIDRTALAEIVFSDDEKLAVLNNITHHQIYKEIERRILLSAADVVCIEIPLLYTAECPLDLDLKVAVVAPRDLRIARIVERDGCSTDMARARMDKQLTDKEYKMLSDEVIENDGELEKIREKVAEIFNRLITGSGK